MSSSSGGPSIVPGRGPGAGQAGSALVARSADAIEALARMMGPAPVSSASATQEVKPRTRRQFESILAWLSQFMASSFDLSEEEARRRLLAGEVDTWQLRWLWFAFGVKKSSGRHSRSVLNALHGIKPRPASQSAGLVRFNQEEQQRQEAKRARQSAASTVPSASASTTTISLAPTAPKSSTTLASVANVATGSHPIDELDNEARHVDEPDSEARREGLAKVARKFHVQPERLKVQTIDPHNEQVLEGFPPPDPADHPLTPHSLKLSMRNFYAGVNRIFKGNMTQQQRRQDFDDIVPFSLLERQQSITFVDVLEKKGYLFVALKRKHILTPAELEQVLASLWAVAMRPIDRLSMGLAFAIETVAGLRPGEMFRFHELAGEDKADNRLAPFIWQDVELFFTGFGSEAGGLEPSFWLTIEWKYGKKRVLGEIIPTQTSSQPPSEAHYCVVRWLLAYGLWLGVFEDKIDQQLRLLLFGTPEQRASAMAPRTRLTVRTEWLCVPVLLWDRSSDFEHKGKAAWKGKNELRLVTMSQQRSNVYLKRIADQLGWDDLAWYDFRRSFVTHLMGRIPEATLRLLLGHRREYSRTAETTYTAQHVPRDQASFAPSLDPSSGGRSSMALARAGVSYGIEESNSCSNLLAIPQVKKRVDAVDRLRADLASDAAILARIEGRTAIDLLSSEAQHQFTAAQQSSLEQLRDAEEELVICLDWATKTSSHLKEAKQSIRGHSTTNPAPIPSTLLKPATADDAQVVSLVKTTSSQPERWLLDLLRKERSPLADKTLAESIVFMGEQLTQGEFEKQYICAICGEFRPRDALEEHYVSLCQKRPRGSGSTGKKPQELLKEVVKSLGMEPTKLPKDVLLDNLMLYHRNQQLPLQALGSWELQKLCLALKTVIPGRFLDRKRTFGKSFTNATREEMLEHLSLQIGSIFCPPGLLDDGSCWDVGTEFKGEDPFPQRREAYRKALKAGAEVTLDDTLEELVKAADEACGKPGWHVHSLERNLRNGPITETRTKGSFQGVTPLTRSVDTLIPEAQGLQGIGRLGLVTASPTLDRFGSNRGNHYHHQVKHLEHLNPGKLYCWICNTWYRRSIDTDHDAICREDWFSLPDGPVCFEHFTKQFWPPASARSDLVTYYLSIDAPTTLMLLKADWIRSVFALLSVCKGSRTGKQKYYLVQNARHKCIVPYCAHKSESFSSIVHHLVMTHKFPIVRRANKPVDTFDVTEAIVPFKSSDKNTEALMLSGRHPQLVSTVPWRNQSSTAGDDSSGSDSSNDECKRADASNQERHDTKEEAVGSRDASMQEDEHSNSDMDSEVWDANDEDEDRNEVGSEARNEEEDAIRGDVYGEVRREAGPSTQTPVDMTAQILVDNSNVSIPQPDDQPSLRRRSSRKRQRSPDDDDEFVPPKAMSIEAPETRRTSSRLRGQVRHDWTDRAYEDALDADSSASPPAALSSKAQGKQRAL